MPIAFSYILAPHRRRRRKTVADAAEAFSRALGLQDLAGPDRVRITFAECGTMFGRGQWAAVDYDFDEVLACAPLRTFRITLNARLKCRRRLLEGIAHEMIHVRQMIAGDLSYSGFIEDGVEYVNKFWKGVDATGLAYAQRPWEQEAHALQGRLVEAILPPHPALPPTPFVVTEQSELV